MDNDRRPLEITRRSALLASAGALGATMTGVSPLAAQEAKEKPVLKGNIKQSVSKWCFGKIPLDEFCVKVKEMGMVGVDLLGPGDFPTLKKHGLICTMVTCGNIASGFNRRENHPRLLADLRKAIEATADAGFPNVICFSGNRAGMSDDEGARNCIEGLKQIASFAEEKKVTVCMELLNSKRDHKDYMCDRTPWGVEVCKGVGSERIKLLYDIYHMQIMEGDIIATIRQYKQYIGHIHTGGVPGRNEIDETQELNYPAIMKALVDAKYTGYVAHEFIPKRDPLTSLAAAVRLCDV